MWFRKKASFSACVYARYRDKILLIHHKRLGLWVPPGGDIERNETPFQAAKRELLQETGLVAVYPSIPSNCIQPQIPGLFRYEEITGDPDKGIRMNFVFLGNVDVCEITPNDEFTEFRWVDAFCSGLEDVPDNVRRNVRILSSW